MYLRNAAVTRNGLAGFEIGDPNTSTVNESCNIDLSSSGESTEFAFAVSKRASGGGMTTLQALTAFFSTGGTLTPQVKTFSATFTDPTIGGTDVVVLTLRVGAADVGYISKTFMLPIGTDIPGAVNGSISCEITAGWVAYIRFGSDAYASTVAFVAPPTAAPAAPTSPSATGSATGITLNWTKSSTTGVNAATGYKVYRGTSANPTTLVATLGDVATYSEAPSNGTTYHYRVTAINSGFESGYTSDVSAARTAPAAPTGLSSSQGTGYIRVNWGAITGADTVTVKRNTVDSITGATTVASGVSAALLTYDDTTSLGYGTYYYFLIAINGAGSSSASASTSQTLSAPVPDPPTIGTLSIDGNGIVTIPLTGVVGVPRLYRHGAGSFAQVVNLSYCWLDLHDNGGGSWTVRTRLPWCGTDPIPLGATGYFRATNYSGSTESSPSSTASIVASVDKSVAEGRWLDSFDAFTSALGGVDTTTSYTANPLLARAYLYYLRPNSTRLGYVSAQWTYAKSHRSTSTDATHALNWWYLEGSTSYQSIDNGGRSAWHVYQAAQILKMAGETTISADMLACVEQAAYSYFNALTDHDYHGVYGFTTFTGPQGRAVNYHWRNGGAGVDAPNQLLWFASLLSMLYHDPASAYYQYAASIPYIQYAIDFAWAAQYASGYIPWRTSDAGRYSGYHLASVEALTAIRRAWGAGWYAHLDTALAAAAAWPDADIEPNCGYWEDGQTYPVTYGLGIIAAQFCRAHLGISDPMDGFVHSAAFLTSAGATIYSFGNEVGAFPPQADSAAASTAIVHELGIRSALLTSPPAPPGGLTATYSAGSVALAWTDNSTDETSFAIERKVDSGSYAAFSTPAAGATTATDSTVIAGHTYRYRIAAVNASGQSAWAESGTVSTGVNLAAEGTASSTLDAALVVSILLAAEASESTTADAALQVVKSLAAEGFSATVGDALLRVARYLAAEASGGVAGDAAFAGLVSLAAEGTASSVIDAALQVRKALSAEGVVSASIDAGLAVVRGLAAELVSRVDGDAVLRVVRLLSAEGGASVSGSDGEVYHAHLSATATTHRLAAASTTRRLTASAHVKRLTH